MRAHITGVSHNKERRAKGRNKKPEIYLTGEVLAMAVAVFMVSFLKIKLLTVLSVLAAIYFLLISSLPRYRRVVARQEAQKADTHKLDGHDTE